MDIEQTWTDLMRQLKSYPTINASQIDAFFSRVQIQAASPGFIMLTSDNAFIKDWIEKHYLKDIQKALNDLYNLDFQVLIEVDPTAAAPAPAAQPAPAAAPVPAAQPAPAAAPVPAAQPAPAATPSAPAVKPQAVQPQPMPAATSAQNAPVPVVQSANAGAPQPTHSVAQAEASEPQTQKTETNGNDNEATGEAALTFDSFVIGESNRMAYNMAVEVADRPGSSELNPLFIYGRSGVGKTHLMCAIQNYIKETRPELNVCYIDSMELVNRYSDAAIEKSVDKQSFKNFEGYFQQADVLLIDDIQGLQSKPGTLNALFRIFNSMIPKGKQFVFSADRAPKNIDLDERYVSRFNSGATIDIQPPDDETKRNIIKSLIRHYQSRENTSFVITDEILDYIVDNSSSNIRELKSAITNVIFAMKMNKDHTLSEGQVKELLGNHFIGGGKKRITIEMIQAAVEDFYGVSHKDIVGRGRARSIVRPRQVAIYLCRDLSETTLSNIGKAFNRDHTTVLHSCELISSQMQEDRNLREELEAVREKIRIQQY